MEKERIKEGLRALYPKVGEDLIEAAATYPTDSMVGKFIARIIARAASYGHAKETIGDLCPVGHELSKMLGASIGDVMAPQKGKTWAGIKAKTFEEWKQEKKAEFKSHGFNDDMTSFDVSEMLKWRPKGELKLRDDLGFGKHGSIEKMLVDEAGPYSDDFLAGFNHESFEQEKIARMMMGMDDPRLHGNERDIWIVRGKPNKMEPFEFEVWSGRYSKCNGAHYKEGPHRNGDWIGWMEKEDYQRPKGQGDGR